MILAVMVDACSEVLAALAQAGDHPLMRCFPQGAVFTWDHELRYLSAGGDGLGDVGLSRELMEGRTIFEVFPAQTVAAIEPLYRAALRGESTTIDVPYADRVYSQHLSPVFDGNGNVVAGMGFTQDVTRVRAAETALRESEQRARLSFMHAPIGKAIVELDGRWRQVNPAVTRLTGYTEDELLGMTFQDITHPEDLDLDLTHLEALVAGKVDSYQMEKRYFTASGGIVWVLLAVSLVRAEDGTPQYFIAQIQDITQRKQQQQALQDMIAMLAHDLRSPLMAIGGFVALLTTGWDTYTDPERLSLLSQIGTAGQAMERLLENTLAVSAVDADALRPQPWAVRVGEVVDDALALVPDAKVAVDHEILAPLVAWVDPTHLTHVVANLLTNAVKYGDGVVTITADAGPDGVRLRISDHGPGVPAEFVPQLFDRFSRSEHSRSGAQRGTGLGLYIVRSLLTANGADVAYSDTPGGGATFTVRLPDVPGTLPGQRATPYRRSVPTMSQVGADFGGSGPDSGA